MSGTQNGGFDCQEILCEHEFTAALTRPARQHDVECYGVVDGWQGRAHDPDAEPEALPVRLERGDDVCPI